MQPTHRTSKTNLLIAALLALAAAVFYAVLFAQIKEKNEHVSALQNAIEQSAEREQRLVSVQKLVFETAALRKKLADYRIAKDNAVSFIAMLEKIGRETNLAVTIASVEVVPRAGADAAAAENLRLVIRFEGGFADTVRYLGLLELLPVESQVEQALVSRTSSGDGKNAPLWRGDATLLALKEK